MPQKGADVRGARPGQKDTAMHKFIAILIVGSTAFGILGPTPIDPIAAMRPDHLSGHHHQSIPLWAPG
jgi:hypothetical protein